MRFPYRILYFLCFAVIACVPVTKDQQDRALQDLAMQQGNRVAALAKKALGSQLKQAIADGGVVQAVQFCNAAAPAILDSLETNIPTTIKRASLRFRNPLDRPSDSESVILKRYQTQLSASENPQPVVEVLNDNQILYARPIVLDTPLCLNCHGTPETEVSEEVLEVLRQHYPEDNALGHQMGDLRGIWSVTFEMDDLRNYLKQM